MSDPIPDGKVDEPMWPMSARHTTPTPPAGTLGTAAIIQAQSGPPETPLAEAHAARPDPLGAPAPLTEQQADTPVSQPVSQRKRPQVRLVALIVVLAAVLTTLIAGTITVFIYDENTKIDRSTPTIAVTQLVDAMFTTRDSSAVQRFSCAKAQLTALTDLAADLRTREGRFHTQFTVSVRGMRLAGSTVTAQLALSASGTQDVQSWVFDTADEDGWRVCAAHRSG